MPITSLSEISLVGKKEIKKTGEVYLVEIKWRTGKLEGDALAIIFTSAAYRKEAKK